MSTDHPPSRGGAARAGAPPQRGRGQDLLVRRRSGRRSSRWIGAFAASQFVSGRAPADLAALSWQRHSSCRLVYLKRYAVLRARETYADVRASVCRPVRCVRRTLEALPRGPVGWRYVWQVHTDPVKRRRAARRQRRF